MRSSIIDDELSIWIAESIVADVKDRICSTPVANSQTDLLKLARMKPAEQRAVAQKIATGEARNVEEAVQVIAREKRAEPATKQIETSRKMRGLSTSTKELIQYAFTLLDQDHPQTLRQLHYAIFSKKKISYENTKSDYQRLSRATTVARRAYRAWQLAGGVGNAPVDSIRTDFLVDETRQGEMVSVWQDATEYIDTVKRCYRRDNWQDQPNYCEVWSEKATILGALRPVARQWGIMLRVCHGFASTGMEAQVGRLFEGIRQPITVFFLGDHDPSGHVIEEDIHRRAEAASGRSFQMRRLAIHEEDIAAFNLPPQTIKTTDSRAESFRRQFGANAATVELDALPAAELRRRVDSAVAGLVDRTLWDRQVRVQQVELNCIAEFAERMKNLPQLGAR